MKTLHVVSILDRSGSMSPSASEVIGAYNAFIEDQQKIAKKSKYKVKATLVLFDDRYEEVYSKVAINEVPTLTDKVYYVRGMTALNDAIGKTINYFKGKNKVQFFIETDGYENASKEYNTASVKKLISEHSHWDFNFVGADLSEAETNQMANSMGITKSTAFAKSKEGYAIRNANFAAATTAYSKI